MDWKEKMSKLRDSLFEVESSDNIPPPEDRNVIPVEPPLLFEQAESIAINGDITATAQQLLEEELSRVTSADVEETIFRVESCIPFVGDFASPETVCKMLQNVAGKDPAVLAEDGKLRIATIEKFIKDNAAQTEATLQEASSETQQIKEEREKQSLIYADSCEAAHRNYDEKLKALQAELDAELASIKEQNDASMAELEERSKKNAQRSEDVLNLSRAVDIQGRVMIEKISKLLALITPDSKPDAN